MTLIKLTREEFENLYFKDIATEDCQTSTGNGLTEMYAISLAGGVPLNEIIDREYAIYLSKE